MIKSVYPCKFCGETAVYVHVARPRPWLLRLAFWIIRRAYPRLGVIVSCGSLECVNKATAFICRTPQDHFNDLQVEIAKKKEQKERSVNDSNN